MKLVCLLMGHNKILESIQDNGEFEYYTQCSQCHKNWRKKESFKFPKIFENKRQYLKMPKIFGIKKEKPSEKNLKPIIVKVSPLKKPQTNFYAL